MPLGDITSCKEELRWQNLGTSVHFPGELELSDFNELES